MQISQPPEPSQTAGNSSATHLSLEVKAKLLPVFFQLLGHGFSEDVQPGCSVKDLLCDQLGIQEDYLNHRIQTIFLNSKVVDNVSSTTVQGGSKLALSGPMPGVAGAILRSGGYYAAMRSQISHTEDPVASNEQSAKITLKLLNLIANELGPVFLQKGIWLNGSTLGEFLQRRTDDLKAGCLRCQLNGQSLEFTKLPVGDWQDELVKLQVTSGEHS